MNDLLKAVRLTHLEKALPELLETSTHPQLNL